METLLIIVLAFSGGWIGGAVWAGFRRDDNYDLAIDDIVRIRNSVRMGGRRLVIVAGQEDQK